MFMIFVFHFCSHFVLLVWDKVDFTVDFVYWSFSESYIFKAGSPDSIEMMTDVIQNDVV